MKDFKELLQSADWKGEKHVPVIEVIEKKDNVFRISVTVGKEIPHPNTTEHHIAWIEVYFLPEGEKFPFEVARFDLSAHGASTKGPNTSTVYTEPSVQFTMKTEKAGTLFALAFCNIHGLWENSLKIEI